ncbi:MAG: lipocalin family protein [Oscillospiraceae bacterium]|nr:lipocalin family protein [Oscillospiraceae bacterium]
MKTTSKISLFLVIALILSVFAACSSPDKKLEGTYAGSYTYDENEFYVEITLKDDGTYTRVYEKNGAPHKSEDGDYELIDGKVRLYVADDHSVWNIYDFVDGHLENEGRVFAKK